MAKVTGPLLSLDASGSVAKTMTFSRWKGINYVRQRVVPTYTNTTTQEAIRLLIKNASQAWSTEATVGSVDVDTAYKAEFATAAEGSAYSGFNLYIRVCVAKNSGSSYGGTFVAPDDPTDITP